MNNNMKQHMKKTQQKNTSSFSPPQNTWWFDPPRWAEVPLSPVDICRSSGVRFSWQQKASKWRAGSKVYRVYPKQKPTLVKGKIDQTKMWFYVVCKLDCQRVLGSLFLLLRFNMLVIYCFVRILMCMFVAYPRGLIASLYDLYGSCISLSL